MNDDMNLRQLAYQMVRAGTLPPRRPDRVWGGAAFGGSRCLLCGAGVEYGAIALEVEFRGDTDQEVTRAHLHSRCFLAMEAALSALESGQPVSAPYGVQRPAVAADGPAFALAQGHDRSRPAVLPSSMGDTKMPAHGGNELEGDSA